MLVVTLAACEEEPEVAKVEEKSHVTVSTDILPPSLSPLESSSATVTKFGVAVDTSQVQDTVYYAILEAPAEAPDGSTLLAQAGVVKFLMSGNVFRPAYQPELSEQTEYVVYALIKKGNYVSETVHLTLRKQSDKPTDPVADEPGAGDNPNEEPVGGGEDGETDGNDSGQEGGNDAHDNDSEGGSDGSDSGSDTGGDDGSGGSDDGSNGGDGSTDPDGGGEDGGSDPGNGGGEPDGIQPTLADPEISPRGTPQRFIISVAFSVAAGQESGVIHYVAIKEKDHTGPLTPQELLDHRFTQTIEMMGTGPRLLSIGADSDTKYYVYALLKIGEEVSGVVLLEAKTEP